ncbi:hypothetical protein KSS87_005006 [Heliosperma pusillum]|nr:hypothetical protein KSS87_005006 [Heliosperma pusillum]
MPSVRPHWYLYCSLLFAELLSTASSCDCGWHAIGVNNSNQLLDNRAVPFCSGCSSGIANGRERSSEIISSSVDVVSCEDLHGVGSFNTTCVLSSNVHLSSSIYAVGTGNLEILPNIYIVCPKVGCSVSFNVSGNVKVGPNAAILSSSVVIAANTLSVGYNSSINTTSLGGEPPSQTSGTPVGYEGAGGGHGGRGASCLRTEEIDAWGGDVYSWSTLSEPDSYGSKGSGKSSQSPFGGNGGGHIKLVVVDELNLNGSITAEGGDGGTSGGGGSGGSIHIYAHKLKGFGTISAAGGRGWGGGGGGRIALYCYSIQDVKVTVHGGVSLGCPENAGAAGTYFDATLLSLSVSNDNISTETETPLLDFYTTQLWSKVIVENKAKALVPLLWTRVQLRGQMSILGGSSVNFGLAEYPVSEFEIVAEELLMSDSTIKVYGALRVIVKMLLMWNSRIQIDGGNAIISSSVLEVRNLAVLRLGPGSLLQAPLDDDDSKTMVMKSLCENQSCPIDLITPPDDCHINSTVSFSLQICRVEDILVGGIIKGTLIHIHRARTIVVTADGMLTASELGCKTGIGKGIYLKGAGAGAGHGGKGGSGMFNGTIIEGGSRYGDADLPCELGSGSEGPDDSYGHVAGGGMIVIGAMPWPLLSLELYGSLRADGQSYTPEARYSNVTSIGGLGGGSGGTVLVFLHNLVLAEGADLSVAGGRGSSLGGGGGGGGRIHFHWSDINTGDEYIPIATVNGTMDRRGGAGDVVGHHGEEGTITGIQCPKGLYDGAYAWRSFGLMLKYVVLGAKYSPDLFAIQECPVGTYKDVDGSDEHLCIPCPLELLPQRAELIYMRGLLLNILRMKLVGSNSGYHSKYSFEQDRRDYRSPLLLSLSEVRGPGRIEETQSHVHRMYFMGPNTFREPWHLPYSRPYEIIDIVYEDAYNRFIDDINFIAAYDWWEGSIHSILLVLACPCAWSWKQWRRRVKLQRLQEYVKSEYDHSCLRSCRARALYKGMKVGGTPDLMAAYVDFFLGGDEKRVDIASIIRKRFPLCIIFGGDGSYMSPYSLHSDALLTNLVAQHVPTSIWNHLVAGLNAYLRTVRHGFIRSTLAPVICWVNSHANPQLGRHGVRIDLGWFHGTASGYCQLGIWVVVVDDYSTHNMPQPTSLDTNIVERNDKTAEKRYRPQSFTNQALSRRTSGLINGAIINDATLKSLEFRKDYFFPFSVFLRNTRPVGSQDTLQLFIIIMILADLSATLLMLVQFYWISLWVFLVVLLILPLSLLSPFPAGLNALFSQGHRRASLARMYALWNATSLSNIVMAFVSGLLHHLIHSVRESEHKNSGNVKRDYDVWWLLPLLLLLLKCIQARFVDWHLANLEIPDSSLYSPDPDALWAHVS